MTTEIDRDRARMGFWGRYRKKPIEIHAVRADYALDKAANDWGKLPSWLETAYDQGNVVFASDHVSIRTLEGVMRADRADWIIQGVKGELYPCKPDIFAATYDPVGTNDS